MAVMDQEKSFPSGLAIVVFGVSGAGKTTIGMLLAETLGCDFLDADKFHSEESIDKMRNGVALSDSDRLPWLEQLRDVLATYLLEQKRVVLACSALKCSYRDILRQAGNRELSRDWNGRVVFVYLKTSEFISARLEARFKEGSHYMPLSLLKSQLAILEVGNNDEQDTVAVDTTNESQVVANQALNKLKSLVSKSPLF